ncbi:MAG TPA: ATP-binding cassette domain-containing protein [Candidatus Elarobacter sp.]|jgi:tungstate transport system ATP-binding protein|nr:ATP-binding cassette domain-containing protein [Candidatus Elarobacter sp.]
MGVTATDLIARRGAFTLNVPAFAASAAGTAVLGPNGAGKTTLLLALQGLIPANGRVERPARCAAVFARPAVLRGSALWNVAVVAGSVLGCTVTEAESRARRALADVGLDEAVHADARTLSTGQRQRLALARALACEPEALFLDEPFANADADGRPALRALVRSWAERSGCAVVLATSSLADAAAVCADALVLRAGSVVHRGPVSALDTVADGYVAALVAEGRIVR